MKKIEYPRVRSMRWSPDGTHLALETLARWPSEIVILSIPGGDAIQTLRPRFGFTDFSWSEDGRMLMVVGSVSTALGQSTYRTERFVEAWDSQNGTSLGAVQIPVTEGENVQVHLNPKSDRLVVNSPKYDRGGAAPAFSGEKILFFGIHMPTPSSPAPNLSKNASLTLLPSGTVVIQDLFSHPTWNPAGNLVTSGGPILDAQTGKVVDSLGRCCLPYWSPDGTKIAVRRGADFEIWSYPGKTLLGIAEDPGPKSRLWRGPEHDELSDSWKPDSTRFVSSICAEGDGAVYIWDVSSLSLVKSINFSQCIFYSRWSPSGNYIAAVDSDGVIHILDAARGTQIRSLDIQRPKPGLTLFTWIAWSPNASLITAQYRYSLPYPQKSYDQIKIFDVSTGQVVKSIDLLTIPQRFSWNQDGRYLITAGRSFSNSSTTMEDMTSIDVYNPESGQRIASASVSPSGSVYLSDFARRLIVVTRQYEKSGLETKFRGDNLSFFEIRLQMNETDASLKSDTSLTSPVPTVSELKENPTVAPVTAPFPPSGASSSSHWPLVALLVTLTIVVRGLIFGRPFQRYRVQKKVIALESRNVDVSEIQEKMSAQKTLRKAEALVREKTQLLKEERHLTKQLQAVEEKKRLLAGDLADGKLSEDVFQSENHRLEIEKARLQEKMSILHAKLYREEYEKPVF